MNPVREGGVCGSVKSGGSPDGVLNGSLQEKCIGIKPGNAFRAKIELIFPGRF